MELGNQALAAEVRRSGEPRRVVVFCLTLLVTALGIGGVLLARGSAVPRPGPILLLALVAALCVNRFALFPTEHASTAEAAVLLAAVVGFRDEAVFLGPLVVALLLGPLDALHWEQRSFVRMAYNAGNRGLATLAASAAFVACHDALGSLPMAWGVIVVVAASVFVVVDLALSVSLLHQLGGPLRTAFRHLLEVDALTLPIAWYGGAVALLLGGVGWWAVTVTLVPAAFVPELVIARAHCSTTVVRNIGALLALVSVLATIALATSVPGTASLAVLVAVGVLAGAEFMLNRRTLLPPFVAIAVVGAIIAVNREHVQFAAALVAAVAVLVSWLTTGRASRPQLVAVVATTLGASILAAEVTVTIPRTLTGIAVGAFAAGLVFEVVGVLTGRDRRRIGAALLWGVPLVAASVAWACVWRSVGDAGAMVFAVAMSVTLAGAAFWGTPAWRSRALQPLLIRGSSGWIVLLTVAIGSGAVVSAAVGHLWVSVGLAESVTAMVAMGVRQWRFTPRARVFGLATLLTVSTMLVAFVPHLVSDSSSAGPVVIAALLALVAVVARQPAARARAGAREPTVPARR